MIYVLRPDTARERMRAAWDAARAILEAGGVARVKVDPARATRTLDQNDKLWATLRDIAAHVEWPVDGRMQKLDADDWKHILSAGLKRQQRIAQGFDGGFVMLGQRTSRMTVGEMAELIELAHAFGAEHGVVWREAGQAEVNGR